MENNTHTFVPLSATNDFICGFRGCGAERNDPLHTSPAKVQATKRPWRVVGNLIYSGDDSKEMLVARAQGSDSISDAGDDANAKLIVRAVNSFDALLEALIIARGYVYDRAAGGSMIRTVKEAQADAETINAALALAKGEK